MNKLTGLLRFLGVASFVSAGAAFLVEGWTDPGVFQRQLLWAFGTLVMTVCGVVSLKRYQDAIGARVFLGLAAATIPAHFAQVGAAIWGLREEGIGTLPQVIAAGALLAALAPPLALGVAALVRQRARLIVALVFVTGLPLLLPTRNGDAIALVALLEVALCLAAEGFVFRKDPLFRTGEGIAARALLFAPSAILLVRNAFYTGTDLWLAALFAAPSLALLVVPRLESLDGTFPKALQLVGACGLAVATAIAIPNPPVVGLALSALALAASELVPGRSAGLAWGAAGLLAAAGVASFLDVTPAVIVAAVPVGALHVWAAFRRRSAGLTTVTAATTVLSAAAHLYGVIQLPVHDVWVPAVALSVALLGLSSVLERRRESLQRAWSRLESHFAAKA